MTPERWEIRQKDDELMTQKRSAPPSPMNDERRARWREEWLEDELRKEKEMQVGSSVAPATKTSWKKKGEPPPHSAENPLPIPQLGPIEI